MNERKRLILFIVISAIILFTYMPVMKFLGLVPPNPTTIPATTQTTQPAPAGQVTPATATTSQGSPATSTAQPSSIIPTLPTTPQLVSSTDVSGNPSDILLGSDQKNDATYAMQLAINPVGGGLKHVVLNKYKQRVDSEDRYTYVKPYPGTNDSAFSTQSITLNGQSYNIAGMIWRVESTTDTATLTLDLSSPPPENKHLVRLQKTFQVQQRNADANSPQGYEVKFSQRVVNLSAQALDISTIVLGPTFPDSELSRGGDRQLIGGYKKEKGIALRYDAVESFTKDAPSKDYTTDKDNHPLQWIGAGTNYFNAIVRPDEPWIAKVVARSTNPDATPHHQRVAIALETTPTGVLAPGSSRDISANLFFGPRLRSLLHSPYYANAGIEYFHTLEISGSCTYCTFSVLVDFLMWLLGIFHTVFRDWGLAIIALVFVVRALLHPITKKSQINMAKMAKMGPEIERIKKKYGDDKDAMNRAMMEFYKNHGATPILGCLPMFLQMPIWIALYSGLSTTFELRHEPFLYGLTWIKDLSKPDHLIEFSQPYSLLFIHIDGLNVIPLLLMAAFYLQYKIQPKPPAMTDEQKSQQKMMMWMTTLLFPLMLYPMPSGLNIYIFASTIFGVIESKIIRNHINQQEALRPTGPQFIEGEVVDPHRSKEAPAKSSGGIFGWFAKLQQRAEELRQDAEKQKSKKRK